MWVVLWRHAGERWLPQQLHHQSILCNTGHEKVDFYLNPCGCIPPSLRVFGWNRSAPALLLSRVDIVVPGTKWMYHSREQANCSTSSAGLWWRLPEVPERCKVQRGSVWSGLGDPSHVPLLMLSRGEADTQPTGVTAPPPKATESPRKWGRDLDLLDSPFTSLSFVSVVRWFIL